MVPGAHLCSLFLRGPLIWVYFMLSIYDIAGLIVDKVLSSCAVRSSVSGLGAHDTEFQFKADSSDLQDTSRLVLGGSSVVVSSRMELFLDQPVTGCTVSRGVESGGVEVTTLKVAFPAGYIRYTEPVCKLYSPTQLRMLTLD